MAIVSTLELLWIRCNVVGDPEEPGAAPPSLTLQPYFLGAYVGNPIGVQSAQTAWFNGAIAQFNEPGDYLELHQNGEPLFVSSNYVQRLDTGEHETGFRIDIPTDDAYTYELTVRYRLSLSLIELVVAYVQIIALNTFLFIRSLILILFSPLIRLLSKPSRKPDARDIK